MDQHVRAARRATLERVAKALKDNRMEARVVETPEELVEALRGLLPQRLRRPPSRRPSPLRLPRKSRNKRKKKNRLSHKFSGGAGFLFWSRSFFITAPRPRRRLPSGR